VQKRPEILPVFIAIPITLEINVRDPIDNKMNMLVGKFMNRENTLIMIREIIHALQCDSDDIVSMTSIDFSILK